MKHETSAVQRRIGYTVTWLGACDWQELSPSETTPNTLRGSPQEAPGNNAVQGDMQPATGRPAKGDCHENAQASQQPRTQINKADTSTDTPAHFPGNHALSTWHFCSASTDLRLLAAERSLVEPHPGDQPIYESSDWPPVGAPSTPPPVHEL